MSKMKTVLVTGAAGFIGAAIARSLLSVGNKVVTIDNLTTGKLRIYLKDAFLLRVMIMIKK